MTERMIINRLMSRDQLIAERDALDEKIKALDKEIQSYMEQEGKEEADVGKWKIFWKLTASMKFSSKKFKEDHPGMYDRYKVESVSTYYKVNRKKGA